MEDLTLTRVALFKLVKKLLKKHKVIYLTSVCIDDAEQIKKNIKIKQKCFNKLSKKQTEKIYSTYKKEIISLTNSKKIEGPVSFRKRRIDNEGNCDVSYKSSSYPRWSGFSDSCFMDYQYNLNDSDCYCPECKVHSGKALSIENTLRALIWHDFEEMYCDEKLTPVILQVGRKKYFIKKFTVGRIPEPALGAK